MWYAAALRLLSFFLPLLASQLTPLSVSAGLAVFTAAPFLLYPLPSFPSALFCLENGNVECVWCNLNPDQHLGSVKKKSIYCKEGFCICFPTLLKQSWGAGRGRTQNNHSKIIFIFIDLVINMRVLMCFRAYMDKPWGLCSHLCPGGGRVRGKPDLDHFRNGEKGGRGVVI